MDITTHKLFVYGTLLHRDTFINCLSVASENYEIISIEPGFIEGKMFKKGNWFPIVVKADVGRNPSFPLAVYGGIITFRADSYAFMGLDVYEGCSLYQHGINSPYDMYHRLEVEATPIRFNSIDDFIKYDFTVLEPTTVTAYLGNYEQPDIKNIVDTQRHRWQLWRSFFHIDEWPEYKNKQN